MIFFFFFFLAMMVNLGQQYDQTMQFGNEIARREFKTFAIKYLSGLTKTMKKCQRVKNFLAFFLVYLKNKKLIGISRNSRSNKDQHLFTILLSNYCKYDN